MATCKNCSGRGVIWDAVSGCEVACGPCCDVGPELEKLRAFKAYVHGRLDMAGVPADPDSPHRAEGCRIGGRLDVLIGLRDELLDACENSLRAFEETAEDETPTMADLRAVIAKAKGGA